jgi:hypothetical protein
MDNLESAKDGVARVKSRDKEVIQSCNLYSLIPSFYTCTKPTQGDMVVMGTTVRPRGTPGSRLMWRLPVLVSESDHLNICFVTLPLEHLYIT